MFHRGFFFGRFIMLLLIIGGAMAVGRGLYRSGYQQGFAQGMVFAAADGEAVAGPAARPFAYGGHRGLGPVEGGFLGFGFLGFAFLAFGALLLMGALGRHRRAWGRHGSHGGWGHHGHYDRRPPASDRHKPREGDIGPEKQPEEYL
jgi:hypothetical protein